MGMCVMSCIAINPEGIAAVHSAPMVPTLSAPPFLLCFISESQPEPQQIHLVQQATMVMHVTMSEAHLVQGLR